MYASTTTSVADYFTSSSTTTSTLVFDNAVRRPATSSRGCTGSTSTTVRCCSIVSRPHQLTVGYFVDFSRLVSTNKLVENGFHIIWPHELYINLAVRCDYSSPGRTGSTSTSLCTASTRLPAAAALHRLRFTPPRRRLLGVRLPRLLTSTSLNQKTSRGWLPRHQQLVGSTSD
jgi:hypothetical protein